MPRFRAGATIAVITAAGALSGTPSYAADLPPTILLDVYVVTQCGASAHCESELAEFVCTATFWSPYGDTAVTTGVSCYAPDAAAQVSPGATAFPGPRAVGAGAAQFAWDSPICVSGSATYSRLGGLYTVGVGPVCRPARSWQYLPDR